MHSILFDDNVVKLEIHDSKITRAGDVAQWDSTCLVSWAFTCACTHTPLNNSKVNSTLPNNWSKEEITWEKISAK